MARAKARSLTANYAPPPAKLPTGYVLKADAVRRLRMHAAATGVSASSVLESLIEKGLPQYGPAR